MYRLLIVEDEKWEREGLRDFLDWNSLGIEVAGCACNGVEGLKMAELYRPDIILTDIMMPKMDGIQMSRNIRAFLPDTRIIILSGYDNFQYAKQSFGFHAFAYILKPIEKKFLEEVIFCVLKVLDQEKSKNRERDALKSQWMNYVSANGDRLLLDLLECKTELKYVHELEPINGLKVQGKKVVAVLSLYQDCNREIINAFHIMLNERGIVFSFSKPLKEAVLCMDAPATQSELETELLQLKDNLKKELGIEAIIAVGEAVEDLSGTPQSYTQAKEASSFRFLAEYGELLFFSKLKETGLKHWDEARPPILKTNSITKKIVYSIQKGDIDEGALLVDEFLSALREYHPLSKMLLSSFFTEVMSGLSAVLPDSTYEDIRKVVWDRKRFGMDFASLDSLSQTRQFLMSSLRSIVVYMTDMKGFKEEEVAKKVFAIVEGRYADELDLKLVSEEIHLSPYYIGRIFKRYTGKVFSQYLNDYRIDMAKEMLQTRKIKVCDLAEAVGIRNSSYFCALFKSRFGISPGDYKDILKGRREYV